MLSIYIPTLRRAHDQVTWRALPKEIRSRATLVVDHSERHLYKAGHDYPSTKLQVMVCPPRCDNIGKVRQFIVDRHDVKKLGPKILMLDDDLNFSKRRKDDPKKFEIVVPSDFTAMLKRIEKLLDRFAHVSIRHREMAHEAEETEYCVRALRALAYDVKVLRENKVRFDRLTVMEDFDVTLRLLRLGFPNAVIADYVQNQRGSGNAGGCSTYRTLEVQAEGARMLAAAHPDFVKIVTKKTKGAWGGGERTDVKISWKKAYLSSERELPR